jgi:signal transduction histidine kinase
VTAAPGNPSSELPSTADQLRALLDAVVGIAGDLDPHHTLLRIARAAAELAGARYAALGVIDPTGDELEDFVTHGLSGDDAARIGRLPRGHGILGLLITDPVPVRLHNLSEHPDAYGFPPGHPTMKSFLGVPIHIRDRVFGNLYLTEKVDGDFTEADEHAVVALAAAAAVVIENARLFHAVQLRERWLTATAEVQRALLERDDLQDALQVVAARARQVVGGDAALVVLEYHDKTLHAEVVDGAIELTDRTLVRGGVLGDVVDHGTTVHVGGGLRVRGLEQLETAVIVPFSGPTGFVGALLVGTTSGGDGRVDPRDVEALQSFANQAAIALDRAQAREDHAALILLADRDRIARDLHEVVIQRLFATGLTLQGAARIEHRAEVERRIRDAVQGLDETITDIRETIFELGRNEHSSGLRGEIHDTVRDAESAIGFRPHLSIRGPIDSVVPDRIRPHLIAVLVEALSNVARHANASQVDVRVVVSSTPDGQWLDVIVRDNGRGLVDSGRRSGLSNLADRAAELGGRFEVESAPGVIVRWSVPLDH